MILEKDPFLVLKFQEAFTANPHTFRRRPPVETPDMINLPIDRVRAWIRASLKNHGREDYQVMVTENELLHKTIAAKSCKYWGCLLRYYRLKDVPLDLWAEVDRKDKQTTLTDTQIIL